MLENRKHRAALRLSCLGSGVYHHSPSWWCPDINTCPQPGPQLSLTQHFTDQWSLSSARQSISRLSRNQDPNSIMISIVLMFHNIRARKWRVAAHVPHVPHVPSAWTMILFRGLNLSRAAGGETGDCESVAEQLCQYQGSDVIISDYYVLLW